MLCLILCLSSQNERDLFLLSSPTLCILVKYKPLNRILPISRFSFVKTSDKGYITVLIGVIKCQAFVPLYIWTIHGLCLDSQLRLDLVNTFPAAAIIPHKSFVDGGSNENYELSDNFRIVEF